MAIKIDCESCTGCGSCVDACPTEALCLEDGTVTVDEDTCIDCGVCVDECPAQALAL